jgi:uncharacterized ion transporter superfamily protein YfcC
VVLDPGRIVDTIIQAMVAPLAQLPTGLFTIGMTFVQTLIALPVPSSSGRAVLTMPILVPLSDLLGLSRQVTVMAYQFGPGIIGQALPTDGALMAVLALAGVSFEEWVRFATPYLRRALSPEPGGDRRRGGDWGSMTDRGNACRETN